MGEVFFEMKNKRLNCQMRLPSSKRSFTFISLCFVRRIMTINHKQPPKLPVV